MSNVPNAFSWAARILAVAAALFVEVFAFDAVSERRGLWASLPDLVMHSLPSVLMVATIVAAWRRPWIGAVVFLTLAAGYSGMAHRRLDWILAISGPLALVAALYVLSWRWHRRG